MGIRILIADRQDMFREALRRMLESDPGFTVVGETGDGEQCLKLAADLKPDVLLLDLNLRGCSGVELLRQIAGLEVKMYPILLTDKIEKSEVIEALRYGARGLVWKNEPTQILYKSRVFSRICGYKPVRFKPMEKWKSPARKRRDFPTFPQALLSYLS